VHQNVATAVESAQDPQDMLFRTYSHLDAYLSRHPVKKTEFELIGLACTLVSTKLRADCESPECIELANWLAFMTDGTCSAEDVCGAAREICHLLGGSLHQPTVYTFLRRYLRQTGWTEASFSLANYLVEIAALDASFLVFRPQVVAATAAVMCRQYASQGVDVSSVPRWKARLLRCAGVDVRQELAPCAALLSRVHVAQSKVRSMFVHQKFESPRLHSVARLRANPPADASFFEAYMAAV